MERGLTRLTMARMAAIAGSQMLFLCAIAG
jgi:hypothetical protein